MAKTHAMNAIIFAGGVGTRMWPLSRKASPKQFEPIIEGKSTLQLAIDRLRPEFAWHNIYISTGEVYRDIILKQVPLIPKENIIGEPEMRDVGPAVGYLMALIAKKAPNTPVAILWSDHLVEQVDVFKKALFTGAKYLEKTPNQFVFIGQKPRFANQNLGWIEFGEELESIDGIHLRKFISWHYRPDQSTATNYFRSGTHAWNPGYFIVMPEFVLSQFRKYTPTMYQQLSQLTASFGTSRHQEQLKAIYPKMEKISFDNAVLEKVDPAEAVVLSVDLGWSDIGTWEALKEALQNQPQDNLTLGQVEAYKTNNCVIYNYTDKLVTTIDINDMVVVATGDVIMVTRQESIPQIKEMLKTFEGTDRERFT